MHELIEELTKEGTNEWMYLIPRESGKKGGKIPMCRFALFVCLTYIIVYVLFVYFEE